MQPSWLRCGAFYPTFWWLPWDVGTINFTPWYVEWIVFPHLYQPMFGLLSQKQSMSQAGIAQELSKCQERARCLLNYSGQIQQAMPAELSAHLMSMENSML
jgi:hypothetical protein